MEGTMKPGKYAVHYTSSVYGESIIHTFAASAEEACQYVVTNGIGYYNKQTVYPDSITGVEELTSPVERVLTNEDAFLTLEHAIDYLEDDENKDQTAVDI